MFDYLSHAGTNYNFFFYVHLTQDPIYYWWKCVPFSSLGCEDDHSGKMHVRLIEFRNCTISDRQREWQLSPTVVLATKFWHVNLVVYWWVVLINGLFLAWKKSSPSNVHWLIILRQLWSSSVSPYEEPSFENTQSSLKSLVMRHSRRQCNKCWSNTCWFDSTFHVLVFPRMTGFHFHNIKMMISMFS